MMFLYVGVYGADALRINVVLYVPAVALGGIEYFRGSVFCEFGFIVLV